jgi:hypothetical protein
MNTISHPHRKFFACFDHYFDLRCYKFFKHVSSRDRFSKFTFPYEKEYEAVYCSNYFISFVIFKNYNIF